MIWNTLYIIILIRFLKLHENNTDVQCYNWTIQMCNIITFAQKETQPQNDRFPLFYFHFMIPSTNTARSLTSFRMVNIFTSITHTTYYWPNNKRKCFLPLQVYFWHVFKEWLKVDSRSSCTVPFMRKCGHFSINGSI